MGVGAASAPGSHPAWAQRVGALVAEREGAEEGNPAEESGQVCAWGAPRNRSRVSGPAGLIFSPRVAEDLGNREPRL